MKVLIMNKVVDGKATATDITTLIPLLFVLFAILYMGLPMARDYLNSRPIPAPIHGGINQQIGFSGVTNPSN